MAVNPHKLELLTRHRDLNPRRYELIILTAIEEFSRIGYDDAHIDTIAIKAGIGKGTIYNYFSGKRELLEETIKYIAQEQTDFIKNAVSKPADFEGKIKAYFISGFKYFEKKQDFHRVMIGVIFDKTKRFENFITEVYEDFWKLLNDLVIQGSAEKKIDRQFQTEIEDILVALYLGSDMESKALRKRAGKFAELVLSGILSKTQTEEKKKFIPIPYKIKNETDYFKKVSLFADEFELYATDLFSEEISNVDIYLKSLAQRKECELPLYTSKSEYCLDMLTIEILNRSWKKHFIDTQHKIVVLPLCLNKKKESCKAVYAEEIGLHKCIRCTPGCKTNSLLQKWDGKKGIEIYTTVSRDSLQRDEEFEIVFQNLLKKHKSVGVLGVACLVELVMGMKTAIDSGIPPQGVPLLYNSCSRWTGNELITTDVYFTKVDEILSF